MKRTGNRTKVFSFALYKELTCTDYNCCGEWMPNYIMPPPLFLFSNLKSSSFGNTTKKKKKKQLDHIYTFMVLPCNGNTNLQTGLGFCISDTVISDNGWI